MAEDLREYGIHVVWNGSERTLRLTRSLENGEPKVPATWPTYVSEPLTHQIGTRAKPVYATDIVTYIAGKKVDSFNINGETLVWVDDLAPFGSVVWHPAERELTLELGDPVEIALKPLIESVEAWSAIGGADSGYKIYECKTGTLLITRYTGTTRGNTTTMLFVKKSGEQVSINDLLPAQPMGSSTYLSPSNVMIVSVNSGGG